MKWHVMKEIFRSKSYYSPLFWISSPEQYGETYCESTHDLFWASGLPPPYSSSTKPEYYPGDNNLGHALELLRNDLI